MLLHRQITPLTRFVVQRLYASQNFNTPMAAAATRNQVHKDQLRYVDRNAKITIRSDIYLTIRAADVLQYPDGTALQGKLFGGPVKNSTADMKFQVSADEKEVEIICSKLAEDSDFHGLLFVPIAADLNIETKDSVTIENIYNQELKVRAQKSIFTKEIKSSSIELSSTEGNISCGGTLLAQTTKIETKGIGSVSLDKPLGALLQCTTADGKIKTNSCYVDSSNFSTNTGAMDLKNVHKSSQVHVHKKGDLKMSGFNGNLFVRSSGGKIELQLSKITGENIIMSDEATEATINISDDIEEDSYISITASAVTLGSSLSHLSDGLNEGQTLFRMSNERDNSNKLTICTKGAVKLGKLSWADNIKANMVLSDK